MEDPHNYIQTNSYKGPLLNICIYKCIKVPCVDRHGADPYVKIIFGNWLAKTKIKRGKLSPVWDETFSFPIDDIDLDQEVLEFQVGA